MSRSIKAKRALRKTRSLNQKIAVVSWKKISPIVRSEHPFLNQLANRFRRGSRIKNPNRADRLKVDFFPVDFGDASRPVVKSHVDRPAARTFAQRDRSHGGVSLGR